MIFSRQKLRWKAIDDSSLMRYFVYFSENVSQS